MSSDVSWFGSWQATALKQWFCKLLTTAKTAIFQVCFGGKIEFAYKKYPLAFGISHWLNLQLWAQNVRSHSSIIPVAVTLPKMSSHLVRNPGIPLDLEWVSKTRINLPAVKRRADTLKTRRSIKKQWQAAWLLRAVTCIDLTTLSGDDTATNVARLCFKAQNPVRQDLLESMEMANKGITTGAVCVYSSRVPDAVKTLKDIKSKVPVASVAAGFPAGRN